MTTLKAREEFGPWAKCAECGTVIGLRKELPKSTRRNPICRDCQRNRGGLLDE